MSVSAITGATDATSTWLTDSTYVSGSERVTQKVLGQDDFLELVVAQMTNQDPLNPKSDTEFIAQMAQFSALEQSKTMQSDMAAMRKEQQLLQANAVLGRAVELKDDNDLLITGTVSAIQVDAGTPKIVVNGQSYDLSTLLSVKPAVGA
jgi:flagellar basal-body rod modification protein FlgD